MKELNVALMLNAKIGEVCVRDSYRAHANAQFDAFVKTQMGVRHLTFDGGCMFTNHFRCVEGPQKHL